MSHNGALQGAAPPPLPLPWGQLARAVVQSVHLRSLAQKRFREATEAGGKDPLARVRLLNTLMAQVGWGCHPALHSAPPLTPLFTLPPAWQGLLLDDLLPEGGQAPSLPPDDAPPPASCAPDSGSSDDSEVAQEEGADAMASLAGAMEAAACRAAAALVLQKHWRRRRAQQQLPQLRQRRLAQQRKVKRVIECAYIGVCGGKRHLARQALARQLGAARKRRLRALAQSAAQGTRAAPAAAADGSAEHPAAEHAHTPAVVHLLPAKAPPVGALDSVLAPVFGASCACPTDPPAGSTPRVSQEGLEPALPPDFPPPAPSGLHAAQHAELEAARAIRTQTPVLALKPCAHPAPALPSPANSSCGSSSSQVSFCSSSHSGSSRGATAGSAGAALSPLASQQPKQHAQVQQLQARAESSRAWSRNSSVLAVEAVQMSMGNGSSMASQAAIEACERTRDRVQQVERRWPSSTTRIRKAGFGRAEGVHQ